jgi:ATP-dependent helicase/nuclease subunit B
MHKPEKAKMLLSGLTHSNGVNQLEDRYISAAFSTPIHTSVSELEQYIQCPFKYFVDSGLKPIPQKQYELGAPDIGTLFHKALELYGKHIYENQLAWDQITKEESDRLIETIVGDITMFDVFQSKHQYKYLINKLKRVSKKAAWVLTEHLKNGLFEPVAFEVAFGRESESAPPIHIRLASGESMLIRGVIDRIDKVTIDDQTYIKIIDYKSGKKQLTMSDIYNGLQMQLMVYLSACLENPEYLKVDKILPAGAFYFRIDDPIIESTAQVAEIIEKQIASALKLDGLALEDASVLRHIDRLIFDNNASDVIEVKVKTDGAFTKDSKLLPLDAFVGLMHHVKQTIQSIGNSLNAGNIEIRPCKTKGFVSCQYCDFKAICQFDPHFEGNHYRYLKAYSNDEVIEKIGEKPHGEMDI